MKRTLVLSFSATLVGLFAGAALIGCSGDDTTTPASSDASAAGDGTVLHDGAATDAAKDGGTTDSAVTDSAPTDSAATDSAVTDGAATDGAIDAATDAGSPVPPTLGVQIDRFGRPAINTALNHEFDPDASAAGTAKDLYNADTDAGAWKAEYTPEFEQSLAILDSLDTNDAGGGCGNQIFAGPLDAGPARYATLAGVLADDRMWINTAASNCTTYLGVELIATGVIPNDGGPDGGPTNECGGRKLGYDVIDITYSAAAIGAISGVSDGISAVPTKTSGATFPYLAPPQ